MKKPSSDTRAGIWITVIAHLAVLIVLLASGIATSLHEEGGYVMDFSKYEEIERMEAEIERLERQARMIEEINQRLEEELGPSVSGSSDVRGVAVDRSALRDDRGTDAEQLYADAERLRQELSEGFEMPAEEQFAMTETPSDNGKTPEKEKAPAYKGPSVVSYDLGGRKASSLPIPAYRCMGGGQVTVIIAVNTAGEVINAKIDDEVSSGDSCLRAFAIRAARMSRFAIDRSAPPRQEGNIVYEFIAQ